MTARRHSKKRDSLVRALANTTSHPSAETLYLELKEKHPDISLGTVYRNLSQLRQDGEIIVAATVHGQERFDYNTEPHTHFVCETCGRVEDLERIMLDPEFARDVETEYGHRVDQGELTFRGVCAHCLTESDN